jgi:hypothetical protein
MYKPLPKYSLNNLPKFVDGILSSSVIDIRSSGNILNHPLSSSVDAGFGFIFNAVWIK